MRLVLGLDIGISSVGWGIIDIEENKIIDAGVRLFAEADKENNESRRGFRSARRLKRRKKLRRKELIELLKEFGLYGDPTNCINPYDARCKGLYEKLTPSELTVTLIHICNHRGSSLEVVEGEKTKDEGAKAVLATNDQLISDGKYVCEIQKERLVNKHVVRGIENNFRSSDYKKELQKLLATQEIDEEQSKQICDCIFRRRHFSDGPGSFKSQTKYGKVYNEDGSIKENMIEKMTGKCSIYNNELRAPKMSPSAEFFNLLNDLNNLKIDDEPLDVEIKQGLVQRAFKKGKLEPNDIAKYLMIDLIDIKGFRLDESRKPIMSKLDGFNVFRKAFKNSSYDKLTDFALMDHISVILTKTKVIEERRSDFEQLGLPQDVINLLSANNKFTTYHSLSLKALRELNDEMYKTQYNQMQILKLSNKYDFMREKISQKGRKKIALKDEAVLSPVAMRSYRQAIKVVNAVRKKYGELDTIVVETTRDKNSKDEKRRISRQQKLNKEQNDRAIDVLGKNGFEKASGKLKMKVRLYLEQQGKTGYTQQPIDLNELINNSTAYEIDHIIPISVSLDDSYNNKVLVTRKENQEKGNRTPIMAFNQGCFSSGSLEQYKVFVKQLISAKPGISAKKYENFMYERDITAYSNMKDFIARNLVDTSYANRLVHNTLMDYFKDNNIPTKVHTVRGSVTSGFRKLIKGLEKDRDKDFSHHAIDAIIVASVKKLNLLNKLFNDFYFEGTDIISRTTGEPFYPEDSDYFNLDYLSFIGKIADYKVQKYSNMVDTKPNRSVAKQTIYSTRKIGEDDYVVMKYKNIYDPTFFTLANDIVNGKKDKYLMARNDEKTFKKIEDIVNYYFKEFFNTENIVIKKAEKGSVEYEFKFNPLAKHLEDTGEVVTKYAKKNNGSPVTQMKYVDKKLGNCIEISNNYQLKEDKKVVLLQISSYRTDFFLDEGVYKFVSIRYSNVKQINSSNKYVINREWYENQKKTKKISSKAEFIGSFHHNEYIRLVDQKGDSIYKFVGTSDDGANRVELKLINCNTDTRIIPTIGKKTKLVRKYTTDVLGNLTEIVNPQLKLEF